LEVKTQKTTSHHQYTLIFRLFLSIGLIFLIGCSENGDGYEDETDHYSDLPGYQILSPDGEAFGKFGRSVSVSGDHIIVGAYNHTGNDISSGTAYIFQRSGGDWTEVTELTASDGAHSDTFGTSVSISGDYAIVGTDYSASESAYIFQRSDSVWTETAKLTASDGDPGDGFGSSVSISGDYAIVGARFDDDIVWSGGAAYIFQRSGSDWTEVVKLTPPNAVWGAIRDARFGQSVSISSDDAIVGASGAKSAYIFQRSGADWVQTAQVYGPGVTMFDGFGNSVSISGDHAIVGAAGYGNDYSGAAFIFQRTSGLWGQPIKLEASDKAASGHFGRSVAISGNQAIVGAITGHYYTPNFGTAYLFQGSGSNWVEIAKMTSEGVADDQFGCSVAISGNDVIIGAPDDSTSGSVYVFNTLDENNPNS
jgi:hypothetical protein